jgi:hypothetical protein
MRQSISGILKLTLAGPAVQLQIKLVKHPESGRPDGMTKTL